MKIRKAWTRIDRGVLAQYYGKYSTKDISEKLDRLPTAIAGEAFRMKLSSRQKAYRKKHLLTPKAICKMISLNRSTVDRMFELGLPYYTLPGRTVVIPKDLGIFLRDRPEITDPETMSPQVRLRLGYTDSYEPPNFKWFQCGKSQSSQWADVWITHPRIWFCKDLFKTRSGMCPVCNRGVPRWAEAYSNECVTEVHEGGKMPKGLTAAPSKGKEIKDARGLQLLELSFLQEFLPESPPTPHP